MPHDLHFLERLATRATGEDQELALSLYRDAELTRRIVELADLPAEADRVALAIWAEPEGPHIVVDRQGSFITCLGAGMSTAKLPVITRSRLDWLRNEAQRVRTAFDHFSPRQAQQTRAVIQRFFVAGPWALREDFEMLRAIAPVMSRHHFHASVSGTLKLVETVSRMPRSTRSLKLPSSHSELRVETAFYALTWDFPIQFALAALDRAAFEGMPEEISIFNPIRFAFAMGNLSLVVRTCWAIAERGLQYYTHALRWWREAEDPPYLLASLLALTSIGCRYRNLRNEIARALRTPPAGARVDRAALEHLVAQAQLSLSTEPADPKLDAVLRNYAWPMLPPALATPYRSVAELPLPVAALVARCCDRLLANRKDLDFERPGISPPNSQPEPSLDRLVALLPRFVNTDAADFFVPEASLANYKSATTPLTRHLQCVLVSRMHAPVTAKVNEPKPQRNAPCPCGSGKKFKLCCGRGKTETVDDRRLPVDG